MITSKKLSARWLALEALIVMAVLVGLFFLVGPAFAQGDSPEPAALSLWDVALVLLAGLPLVGGAVGVLNSVLVNLVKVVVAKLGRPLEDGKGGELFLILNGAAFIALLLFYGINAAMGNTPDELNAVLLNFAEQIKALVAFLDMLPDALIALVLQLGAAAIMALSQLKAGEWFHSLLNKLAPQWVNTARIRKLVHDAQFERETE